MDIFCAPSRWEAGPYAVLEAMACGLPVVASQVAGHTDYVVEGVTGRLVSLEFPALLARALRELLTDPDTRTMLGETGRQRVERAYALEPMVAATAAVYRQAVGNARPTPDGAS